MITVAVVASVTSSVVGLVLDGAVGNYLGTDLDGRADPAVGVQGLVGVPSQYERVVLGRDLGRDRVAAEGDLEAGRCARGRPYDDHLVGVRRENLTGEGDSVSRVAGPHDRVGQVQRPFVPRRLAALAEVEQQFRQRNVGPEGGRPAEQMLTRKRLRLGVSAGEEVLAGSAAAEPGRSDSHRSSRRHQTRQSTRTTGPARPQPRSTPSPRAAHSRSATPRTTGSPVRRTKVSLARR